MNSTVTSVKISHNLSEQITGKLAYFLLDRKSGIRCWGRELKLWFVFQGENNGNQILLPTNTRLGFIILVYNLFFSNFHSSLRPLFLLAIRMSCQNDKFSLGKKLKPTISILMYVTQLSLKCNVSTIITLYLP